MVSDGPRPRLPMRRHGLRPRTNRMGIRKRGPGIRNRRQWSAERRLPAIASGKDTPRSVSGGHAGRSRGLANPCVSRRSAPPRWGAQETGTTACPGPVKNTGAGACLRLIPPPPGEGNEGTSTACLLCHNSNACRQSFTFALPWAYRVSGDRSFALRMPHLMDNDVSMKARRSGEYRV
jgi:hypothetical protein